MCRYIHREVGKEARGGKNKSHTKTLPHQTINEKVASMPDRLRAVKDGDGKMTGY